MKSKLSTVSFLIVILVIIAAALVFLFFYARGADSADTIVISEIIPSNKTLHADKYDHHFDIVELYNPTSNPIDLTGYGLSDNVNRPHKWVFPSWEIQPDEYLIVYLSGDKFISEDELYANFSLDKDGEAVVLTNPDNKIMQIVPYMAMQDDMSLSLINGEYEYVSMGTPGKANNKGDVIDDLSQLSNTPFIVASEPSGVYSQPVYLKLESESGLDIRYTLDGTTPTSSSQKYNVQVYLDYSESNPVLYSNIPSTFDEQDDIQSQYIEKATVVKAQLFDGELPVGDIFTGTYFIWQEGSERYTFDIVSLTTDPDNLFNPYTGIYVVGDFFYRNAPDTINGGTDANYNQRGMDWEREAYVEFFDSQGMLVLEQNIGIRIFGEWSRSFPKKSFKLFPRTKYDDSGKLEYPFFDNLMDSNGTYITSFDKLILRNGGQDWNHCLFTDPLVDSLVEGVLDYQAYKPVILFLNGEYWGIYHLREHMDENYVTSHFNVDKDKTAIIMQADVPEIYYGDIDDLEHYLKMLAFAENNDLTIEENFAEMERLIDLDNFIDYYCLEMFIDNGDWPGNNVKLWRYTGEYLQGNEYTDGRYRFLLFDTEFGFGLHKGESGYMADNFTAQSDMVEKSWPNPWWSNILYKNLMENLEFRERFLTTYADYLNSIFSHEAIKAKLDEFTEMYAPEMEEYINRYYFYAVKNYEDWEQDQLDRLRAYAEYRGEYVFLTAKHYYNIADHYSLEIMPYAGGEIIVNDNYTVKQEGQVLQYFDGYQIKIETSDDSFGGWVVKDALTGDVLLDAGSSQSADGFYRVEEGVLYVVPKANVIISKK